MIDQADDELIVKHIRLCECGRPAGHNSLCLSNAAERSWVAVEAEDRRDRSDARKQRVAKDGRAHRASLTDWQLVELARQGEQILSTVAAAKLDQSVSGSKEGALMPTTQAPEYDPRWRFAKFKLRQAAEQLIELVEETRGHGVAAGVRDMLGEHKDKLILECVGLKPRDVVKHLGPQVAGGTRTVERVREAAGDCRWCGREWPS
jgi:hypothetical protein